MRCAWNNGFVSAPRATEVQQVSQQKIREGTVLGLATGLLTAEPAHAGGAGIPKER